MYVNVIRVLKKIKAATRSNVHVSLSPWQDALVHFNNVYICTLF